MEIEGLLTYPASYKKGKKYPLLLIVHGGTTGIFVKDFIGNSTNYPVALFASEGFAVLRCNIRGSDGYGINFRKATLMDLGGMDYQDLMSGVDYVINMGVADKDRLGVMGWSYGGYMAAWIITQTRLFKAASVGAGIANLVSAQGTTDLQILYPDYFGCQFWENPDLYIKRSPLFNIKGVTTRTLILHGENDNIVPVSQGYELYNALKGQNVPVEMAVYPRSGHNISEPVLALDLMTRNLIWFRKYGLESMF